MAIRTWTVLLAALTASCGFASARAAGNRSFVISGTEFLRDGVPFQVVSGSYHYFRTPASEWAYRLRLMADCGLNAVQTYVPWNVHEPEPGVFDWDGDADLGRFLDLARDAGLLVVLRPGPYICAEWEFGGLPYWLLSPGGNGTALPPRLRSSDPAFLGPAEAWWRAVAAVVAPRLYARGGAVAMVQVENEYGTYGSDRAYLEALRDLTASLLPGAVVYSTDLPQDNTLTATDIPGVFQTVDFGTGWNASVAFAMQRKYQATGPLYNSEFYTGWLDLWHAPSLATVPPGLVASKLDDALSYRNASVNMYMFVGSTNFGFMNGADLVGDPLARLYEPQITSYDYDSPVRENGTVGAKYAAVCEVVQRHTGLGSRARVLEAVAADAGTAPASATTTTTLNAAAAASLWSAVDLVSNATATPGGRAEPPTFEEAGQAYGFALHSAQVRPPSGAVTVEWLRDRATFYVDRVEQGTLSRTDLVQPAVTANLTGGEGDLHELAVLVENLGRGNFGVRIDDAGAGVRGVMIGGQRVQGNWTSRSMPLASVTAAQLEPALAFPAVVAPGPAFYVFHFAAPTAPVGKAWTSVSLPGWTKGSVFVNGFNAGRYWRVGPQTEIHIPQDVLLPGKNANTLVLFELHAAAPSLSVTVTTRVLLP